MNIVTCGPLDANPHSDSCDTQFRSFGERDVPVRFGGVRFVPGHHRYGDEDAVPVTEESLSI